MGFIRAEFSTKDSKVVATIVWSYYYFWETAITETFDTLEKAKDWVLDQRCYHQIDDHTTKPANPEISTTVPKQELTTTISQAPPMPDNIPYPNQTTNTNHFKRHRKN